MVFWSQQASCLSASDITTVIAITRRTFRRKLGGIPRRNLSVLVRKIHFVNRQKFLWKERSQAQRLWTGKLLTIVDSNFWVLRSVTQLCDKRNMFRCSGSQLPDWHTCVERNEPWPIHAGFVVNKVTLYLCSIPVYIQRVTFNKTTNLESLEILQHK